MDRSKKSFVAFMLTTIATIAILDQLIKTIMLNVLADGNIIYLIGNWFRFRLLFNSGAAFSLGEGHTWIFTCFQLAFVTGVVIYSPKVTNKYSALGLAMIGGGALGNLIDRLFRAPQFFLGHVVDYVSVGNFAVFNLADSAITVGVVIFMIAMFFEEQGAKK